jgi:hypothetical protein
VLYSCSMTKKSHDYYTPLHTAAVADDCKLSDAWNNYGVVNERMGRVQQGKTSLVNVFK